MRFRSDKFGLTALALLPLSSYLWVDLNYQIEKMEWKIWCIDWCFISVILDKPIQL